jgi:hypothetical protein
MTPLQGAASRLRARGLLTEAERLEREMAVLIEQLTVFASELHAQLDDTSDTSGGEHGPAADGGVVH